MFSNRKRSRKSQNPVRKAIQKLSPRAIEPDAPVVEPDAVEFDDQVVEMGAAKVTAGTAAGSKVGDESTEAGLTELLFILDRSGSMGGLEDDTIGGFNAVIDEHRNAPGDAVVSTILFDHVSEVLHDRVPIQKVRKLMRDDYTVRGSTALYDAVGNAVRFISKIRRYLPADATPTKTIVVIVTDGYENASRTWSLAELRKLIERKREEGWEFLFLGANIDAEREAETLGMDRDFAATYVADGMGNAVMYEAVAQTSKQMRYGARPSVAWKADIDRDRASRRK